MNSVLPLLAFSFALERSVGELCLTSQDKAAARPVTHINVTSLQNAQKCKTAMPRLFSEKFVVILPKQLFINPAALCSLQMEKRLFVVLKGKQKLERKHNLIFMLSLHSSLFPLHSPVLCALRQRSSGKLLKNLFPVQPSPRSNMLSASNQSPYLAFCFFFVEK